MLVNGLVTLGSKVCEQGYEWASAAGQSASQLASHSVALFQAGAEKYGTAAMAGELGLTVGCAVGSVYALAKAAGCWKTAHVFIGNNFSAGSTHYVKVARRNLVKFSAVSAALAAVAVGNLYSTVANLSSSK